MFDNWRLKISLEKIIGKVDSYRCPVLHEHTSDSFGTAETTCPSIMSSSSLSSDGLVFVSIGCTMAGDDLPDESSSSSSEFSESSLFSSDSDLMDPFSPADSSVRTGTLDCTAAGRCGRVVR
jgi:hypothetical protein